VIYQEPVRGATRLRSKPGEKGNSYVKGISVHVPPWGKNEFNPHSQK